MKWRILFKNRKHIDIDQNVSEKEAREIAKSARPKWDEPTVAMIDPPPAVRHCQGCGQFMPIDCLYLRIINCILLKHYNIKVASRYDNILSSKSENPKETQEIKYEEIKTDREKQVDV